mgnify:CR=1 FL=1
MNLNNKDMFSKLKRKIINPSVNIRESVLISRLNKIDANINIIILIFISILKILDSNNIRIEYADNRRPKIPNLFNIRSKLEWGPEVITVSEFFTIFKYEAGPCPKIKEVILGSYPEANIFQGRVLFSLSVIGSIIPREYNASCLYSSSTPSG